MYVTYLLYFGYMGVISLGIFLITGNSIVTNFICVLYKVANDVFLKAIFDFPPPPFLIFFLSFNFSLIHYFNSIFLCFLFLLFFTLFFSVLFFFQALSGFSLRSTSIIKFTHQLKLIKSLIINSKIIVMII